MTLSSTLLNTGYDSLIAVAILVVGAALAIMFYRSKSNKVYNEQLAEYKNAVKKLAEAGQLDLSAIDKELFSTGELNELSRASSAARAESEMTSPARAERERSKTAIPESP